MIRIDGVPELEYLDPNTLILGKTYEVIVVGLGSSYRGPLVVGQTTAAVLHKEGNQCFTFRIDDVGEESNGDLCVHSGYARWVDAPYNNFAILEATGEIDD